MTKYQSKSEKETKQIAANLARQFDHGVIALTGELGAGKTTFVQGFAKGLGVKEKIISPTFVLIRQHQIPKSKKMLFHIDLYRLEGEKHFNDLGLKDFINDSNHLILIEWAEKVKNLLPKNIIWIFFKTVNKQTRSIRFLFLPLLLLVLPFAFPKVLA